MRKLELSLLVGLLLAVIISPAAAFAGDALEIRGEVLRLHILAESNRDIDQQHKLAVRNALLQQSDLLFPSEVDSLGDAIEEVSQKLSEIEQIATETLRSRGCYLDVEAEVVRMYFDTRIYDGVTMPAGVYDALRVVIGSGDGENWWCVMYPPLCLPAAQKPESEELETLPPDPKSQDIHELSTGSSYRMGFAVVDILEGTGRALQEILSKRS